MKHTARVLLALGLVIPLAAGAASAQTAWTPGFDGFKSGPNTKIDFYDVNRNFIGPVFLSGDPAMPTAVQRCGPYLGDDGRYQMQTRIYQLHFTGNVPAFGGPINVYLEPGKPSTGFVKQCNPGSDNPAESGFLLHYEILTTLAAPMNILHSGEVKLDLPCSAGWNGTFPPSGEGYQDPRLTVITDDVGTILGYALHEHQVDSSVTVDPPPDGNCSIPTLSEWGFIIFGTALLAGVAVYIWRRRRLATV